MVLTLSMGSILEAKTESIVNPTNAALDMTAGQVSKILLEAEPKLATEINSLKSSFKK